MASFERSSSIFLGLAFSDISIEGRGGGAASVVGDVGPRARVGKRRSGRNQFVSLLVFCEKLLCKLEERDLIPCNRLFMYYY